ncbi:MAG: hypothetical protein ACT4OZ_05350 [Gemmatimonadota bacterium]
MKAVLAMVVATGDAPRSEVLIAALSAVAPANPRELIDDVFFELTPASKNAFLDLNRALREVSDNFPGQLQYGLFAAFGPSALRP